ncbi:MAG: sulfatase-like hydrolase/transferase, partial [Thermoguttaceae bacterium]|nr:sulfatase-like hydrolase/transferase [Thermoguttaceae bacterium]
MRRLQKFWAVVLVLGVFSEQGSAGGEPAEASRTADRPNILFILADDLGVYDLGCYGRTEHHTPHLDRLASQGVRFTCAYAASPVCSPSRAAILTGKDPARLHLTTFLPGRPDAPSQKLLQPKIAMQLPLEETTLAEYLKQAGYATACIGKWHLGGKGFGPAEQGFDFVHPGQANTTPSETEGGKGEYDLTAAAERFIQQNRQRPFFLYLCHNSPHIPYTARQALVEKNAKAFEPVYAAVIETLDDAVGRLLETLDRLGLADRTMVIFTSDNGGLHVPEGPHRLVTHNGPFRAGKGFLYEGGLRIPLIVRWPGRVPAGNIIDQPMIHTDWTPTLLDLVGLPVPKDLDGQSMARLLCPDSPAKSDLPGSSPVATKGQPTAPRPKTIPSGPLPEVLEKASSGGTERLLFWHFPHYTNQGGRPGGAVRQGPWKLIQQYETGQLELYNLDQDVGETQNLADKMPELANRLRQDLENWCKQIGAQENQPNPDFDPALHRALYIDADPSKFHPQKASPAQIDRMQQWRRQMNAALPQTERPKPKTKASPKPVPSSENPTVQHPQQSPAQPSSVGPSPAGQSLAKPSTAEHSSATRIPTQQVPPEPLPAEYSPAKQAARPNIVIILADDLGYSDLGCYGGEIETPHLDRLAAGGLRFTQCYNSARCWPSRAALMTGYYPQQVRRDTVPGVRSGAQAPRPPWAPLVSEMLRQHGYRCYHSGKWHIDGSPLAGGFDHSYLLEDHNRFFTPKNHMEDDRPLPPPKPEDGYYATSAIAQYAIKYLQQHHQQYPHRPFFLYLCFTAPHFPLQAPQEAVARYLDRYKIGWNQIQQQRGQRLRQMGLVGHDPPPMERHLGPPYHFPEALKILGPG